jgi:cytochrome c oxidase assembly protein Cox11
LPQKYLPQALSMFTQISEQIKLPWKFYSNEINVHVLWGKTNNLFHRKKIDNLLFQIWTII